MFGNAINHGLLFNHLPELILHASKGIDSYEDLFVKLSRVIKEGQSITCDHQIFRKARAGALNYEEFESYLNVRAFDIDINEITPAELKNQGAWCFLKGAIAGSRAQLGKEEDYSFHSYWDFLSAHCDLEHDIIKKLRETKETRVAHCFIRQWLLIDKPNLISPTPEESSVYLIRMVMYWAALFELYEEIDYGAPDFSILEKVIPQATGKKSSGGLSLSSECMLEAFKARWGKDNVKRKVKWADLYRDIVRKQLKDPDIDGPSVKAGSAELVDPDISAIKKRFERWRKGKQILSMEDVRKDLLILRCRYAETEKHPFIRPFLFVNLFTLTQVELKNHGVSADTIVEEFSHYQSYKQLVKNRFVYFQQTHQLTY
ncbi:hypothetical protein [Pseudoalteromonas rubra]|uniref:hypothetical protein n=1 Tax=Pseudoalteromonas rubra TaxID=43658 RepID=UPI000F7A16A4|nr:hypothetical protein [Pseudoalteromonas rubra]